VAGTIVPVVSGVTSGESDFFLQEIVTRLIKSIKVKIKSFLVLMDYIN
jgi:hypothetical protein